MKQFTLPKRKKLHDLLQNGENYRDIRKILGFSISSISDEINRNGGLLKYCPFLAEKRAQELKDNREKRTKLKTPGKQNIAISITYRDALNNEYSIEKYVSAQVLEEKAVVVSNLEVEWSDGLKISGDVSNNGWSKVYNVMLILQSDKVTKTYYLGTIEPSDFDTFEFTAENVSSATLTITWNNELGYKVEETIPIKAPPKMEFKTESNPMVVIISVIVVVVIVIIAALAWVRRK